MKKTNRKQKDLTVEILTKPPFSLNPSPFSLKSPYSSQKSASSDPLPKNRLLFKIPLKCFGKDIFLRLHFRWGVCAHNSTDACQGFGKDIFSWLEGPCSWACRLLSRLGLGGDMFGDTACAKSSTTRFSLGLSVCFRSEKLQNKSSPNFSDFRPEFYSKFCSEFPRNVQEFSCFVSWETESPKRIKQNPRHFSMQNSEASSKNPQKFFGAQVK